MITFPLLLTFGSIAFSTGLILILINFILMGRNGISTGKFMTHFVGIIFVWIGGMSCMAGFLWFLATVIAGRH